MSDCEFNKRKLCSDNDCVFCFDKSFASCEKSSMWCQELNGDVTPRQVFKNCNTEYYFYCTKCDKEFKRRPSTMVRGGECPNCYIESINNEVINQ